MESKPDEPMQNKSPKPIGKKPQPTRKMGTLKGQISVPDDFDTAFADEIADMFKANTKQ